MNSVQRGVVYTAQGMYPTAIIALVEINRSISDDIEHSLSMTYPDNIPAVQCSYPHPGNHASNIGEQADVEGQPSGSSYA
jgi:hypothetical protein